MTVTNTVLPVISDTTPQKGQTISTTNGSWTFDEDYLTYTYEWFRCDSAGTNCAIISGASSSSYTVTLTDVGYTLLARVTATEHINPTPPSDALLYPPPGFTGDTSNPSEIHDPTMYPGYTHLVVTNANKRLFLTNGVNYFLEVTEPLTKELWIEGGNNVVCLGAHITCSAAGSSSYQDNTAVKVRGGTDGGTVHLEGILCDGQYLLDAFAIATSTSIGHGRDVIIQNCRGEYSHDLLFGGHADGIQIQGGVRYLKTDLCTFRSERQCLFTNDGDGPVTGVSCSRTDFVGTGAGSAKFYRAIYDGSQSVLYQTDLIGDDNWHWYVAGVVDGREQQSHGYWPNPDIAGRDYATTGLVTNANRRCVEATDGRGPYVTWMSDARISGKLRAGKSPSHPTYPARSEQRPASGIGFGYTSPGYGPVTPPSPPPPSSPTLLYTPPGYDGTGDRRDVANYPGYSTASFTMVGGYPQTLTLNDSTDYVIDMGLVEWSSYPYTSGGSRTGLRISGGRNVVIVGGELLFHSTNKFDDCAGLQIIGGDPSGTVYIEGVKITSVNGMTISTPRNVVVQMSHIYARTYNDDATYNHADACQIWTDGAASCEMFWDHVTCYTHFTGLTALIDQPTRWRRDNVDLHFGQRISDSQQMGNYMLYLSPGNTSVTCYYDGGTNNWMDLGYWGGIREQLQMAIDSPSWTTKLGYTIRRGSTEWSSNDPNHFRGTEAGVGAMQGDEWRCTSNARITERWKWGKPAVANGATNGEFVPNNTVGADYVPV